MNNRSDDAVPTNIRLKRWPYPLLSPFKRLACAMRSRALGVRFTVLTSLIFCTTAMSATSVSNTPQRQPEPIAASCETHVELPDVLRALCKGQPSQSQTANLPIIPQQIAQDIEMPQLQNWQQANAKVQAIGGWRVYASESAVGAVSSPEMHQHKSAAPTIPEKVEP